MRTLIALLALAALNPGCSCANGHLEPSPFRAQTGNNLVNCNCNLSFRHEACSGDCYVHFGVQMCVPPELRNVSAPRDGGAPPDVVYAQRLDDYCRDTVTSVVYNMIQVWNGAWCEYKKPFAPNGGVGSSVYCFAQEIEPGKELASADEPSCEKPCAAVPCVYKSNCTDVQDELGNVHLDRCRCSQVTENQCRGEPKGGTPTPVFCRPDNARLTR